MAPLHIGARFVHHHPHPVVGIHVPRGGFHRRDRQVVRFDRGDHPCSRCQRHQDIEAAAGFEDQHFGSGAQLEGQ
jgi:hypothetical protein